MSFTEQELKPVKLDSLQALARTYEVPTYGKKADIAGRITLAKGGKGALTKLIKTSAKEKESKGKATPTGGKKAEFFKKERARLITAGATDKKKIEAEIKRLWEQSTSKCKGGICKKSTKATDDKATIITSDKMLTPAEAKARNLALVGANASNGITSFTYKVISSKQKPLQTKPSSDEDEDEEMVSRLDIEDEMIARLKAKMAKKKKREHLDGMTEVFGVDTKGWSLAHAQEELVIQMMNYTDDEDDDDDDDEDDDEEEDDEEEEEDDDN